ncbi:hypothetical protein ACFWVM_29475 [Nocardia fluminea]|uniref:hypothetical protein n=1 Tax=Nocardia fluminea TaxID=134984 RepID=UPI003668E0C5
MLHHPPEPAAAQFVAMGLETVTIRGGAVEDNAYITIEIDTGDGVPVVAEFRAATFRALLDRGHHVVDAAEIEAADHDYGEDELPAA